MSWLQKLYETYEVCCKNPDFTNPPHADGEKAPPALMPVSHTTQQAQIHIVLDGDGDFQRAELLPPKTQIVIPATEKSAGRTGDDAPHPLADKIHYCAADYTGAKEHYYSSYSSLLKAWCDSPHSHPKARAVYAYISKGRLVRDLVEKGILHADASGELLTQAPEGLDDSIFSRLTSKKVNGVSVRDQGEALVVWSVVTPGDIESRTWQDASLQRAWINFDASLMQQKNLCMVQGEENSITVKHPRNIRRPGDGAKLISGNDTAGFTFRGRFLEAADACSVGYEVSHKAHNALRWLIVRQGYRNGEQVVVAWAVDGAKVPGPCEPIPELTDADFLVDEDTPLPAPTGSGEKIPRRDVGFNFSQRLNKAMQGYQKALSSTEGISVLALDAAGPGRLSASFYREQMLDEYLRNLKNWQNDFAWLLPVQARSDEGGGQAKAKTRTIFLPYAPAPDAIARVAYGRRIDDKLRKATVERLLPCIVDGAQLPRDLVESCIRRACNRPGLEKWEWPEVLGAACAVYKGFSHRQNKEQRYTMTLDADRSTRDYLFGRLLAVAEYVERTALEMGDEKRPTNAERLMQRFADYPNPTWRQLELHLSPYIQRLRSNPAKGGLLGRALKTMQEVFEKFTPEDFTSSAKLGGEFLLGYHCQMTAFYTKTEKDNNPDATGEQGE